MDKLRAILGICLLFAFSCSSAFNNQKCAPAQAPFKFSGLKSISKAGCTGVQLNWDSIEKVSYFSALNSGTEPPLLPSMISASKTSALVTGQTPIAGKHRFRVRALDVMGLSDVNTVDLSADAPSDCTADLYKETVLADSPVGYWRLGETSGTLAADSSGNGNNGTYTASGISFGKAGILDPLDKNKAVSFDGTSGSLTFSCLSTVKNTFKKEAWIKPTSVGNIPSQETSTGTFPFYNFNQKALLGPANGGCGNSSIDSGAGILAGTDGIAVIEHGISYMPVLAIYRGDISTDSWHHIAVVYQDKKPSIYLDGVLVRTNYTSARTAVYPANSVGDYLYGGFPGSVDEVAIYSTALSASRIEAHYGPGQ